MPIRVVLADDNYLLREGVRQLIETQPELELAAVAADLDSLMAAVEAERPDVVITDIRMPPTGTDEGIRAAGEIRAKHPNTGVVVHADFLGIYGNCVIIDHGLGVQSLYAHLSSIGVKVGDAVKKGQEIGRTGSTGLAGGDHLHFTMLLQGTPVNPVEWWDQHWLQDRVNRKITEAGGRAPQAP